MNEGSFRLVLPSTLEASLARGHFWVYRDHVPQAFSAPAGSWVRIEAGRFVGYALWDPASAVALRIFSRAGQPDQGWIALRVRDAWELREPLRKGKTTAFRWIGGEGDGLPGVVVDCYAGFAVLVTYSDALEPIVPWVVEALQQTARLQGIVRRHHRRESPELELLSGRRPPRELIVEEHGVRFMADLTRGQKTGLFLDQRENRKFVARYAAGRRMLNLFSYTGGFSVHAAFAGSRRVTSVDCAPEAMADARRNFELNGLDPDAHDFVVADAYALLTEAKARGERFELVVCDPPSLGHTKEQARQAARAYRRLFTLALAVTEPGGYLAASSCTAQVGPELFREVLAEAAERARAELQIVHEAGQPIDHPVLAQHPEGRYLKFVVGRKLLPR